MSTRSFEFVGGNSAKFWQCSVEGPRVTVRFGRIGSAGQTQAKDFPDAAAAHRHAEKCIQDKLAKGYLETVAR